MLVYSEKYLNHHLSTHVENKERLEAIVGFLKEKNVFEKVKVKPPRLASEEELSLVHSAEHINKVKKSCKHGVNFLDPDTYVTKDSYEIAKLAAGGVIGCVEEFFDGEKCSFALVRPPGHHATRDRAMGFCLFNNIAIAAKFALKKLSRVFIFDFDLHHGNGTQEAFYFSDRVFYFSFHQYPWYPGTGRIHEVGEGSGEGFNANLPLPEGTGDKSYLKAIDELVLPLIDEFKPELTLVSAGFDAHSLDPLGRLNLSTACYYEITRRLRERSRGLILCLEGGYHLKALAASVYACTAAMFGLGYEASPGNEDRFGSERVVAERIGELKSILKNYWSI